MAVVVVVAAHLTEKWLLCPYFFLFVVLQVRLILEGTFASVLFGWVCAVSSVFVSSSALVVFTTTNGAGFSRPGDTWKKGKVHFTSQVDKGKFCDAICRITALEKASCEKFAQFHFGSQALGRSLTCLRGARRVILFSWVCALVYFVICSKKVSCKGLLKLSYKKKCLKYHNTRTVFRSLRKTSQRRAHVARHANLIYCFYVTKPLVRTSAESHVLGTANKPNLGPNAPRYCDKPCRKLQNPIYAIPQNREKHSPSWWDFPCK